MNFPNDDSNSAGDQQWVTSLQSTDVLVGRGSGPNDHEGNIMFRSLVRDRKSEYMATSHRETKTKIAREIIDTVLAQNGRFMKKIDPAEAKKLGIPKGVDAYHPVDERTIMEKAKQALRQKVEAEGGDSPDHPSPEASPSSTPSIPSETLPHYAHETSDEVHWDTEHHDHTQIYAPNQGHLLHALPRGAYLSEDDPPSQQMMAALSMAQLDHERVAEMSVHHNAVLYDGDKEPCYVIDDEETRRQTLGVEDLMRSFHRVVTDEFGSSRAESSNSNCNQEFNESMGTIDPSSYSVASMSSLFKGDTLYDSPRSSFTGHDGVARRDSSRFSFRSTGHDGVARRDSSRFSFSSTGHDGVARRDSNRISFSSIYSGTSDVTMSLSHLDCDSSPRSGHHVSLILEGEGEEDEKGASKASLSLDPRYLVLMVEHPDSLDALGDSSKKFIQSALGKNGASSWFSGASKASLS